MKQTIFKGTINGKTFDSVQSYNEEMTRVLAAGESVMAESHTETVNTTNDLVYPGFEDGDGYYLDRLVTGDENKDCELYTKELNDLSSAYDKLKNVLENSSKSDINNYMKHCEEIYRCIYDDSKYTDECIEDLEDEHEEITKRLKKLDAKLKVLRNSKKVINLYQDFYEDIERLATEKPECACKGCKCQQESQPMKVETKDDQVKTVKDAVATLNDLVKSIFG